MEPVQIKIAEVLPNGIMTIHFSEMLKSYEDLKIGYHKRMLIEDFLEIIYVNNNDGGCTPIRP